jgi:hypothetical protein
MKKMADVNIDTLMKHCIKEICEKGIDSNPEKLWYSMTRRMFRIYPHWFVINKVLKASEEANEKFYKNFKIPNFEKIKIKGEGKIIKGKIRETIDANLKISDVAYNYKIKNKGKKYYCPFHDDKDPSLILNDQKNIFHCFGCGAKGDIIEFVRRLENGNI